MNHCSSSLYLKLIDQIIMGFLRVIDCIIFQMNNNLQKIDHLSSSSKVNLQNVNASFSLKQCQRLI